MKIVQFDKYQSSFVQESKLSVLYSGAEIPRS